MTVPKGSKIDINGTPYTVKDFKFDFGNGFLASQQGSEYDTECPVFCYLCDAPKATTILNGYFLCGACLTIMEG